MVSVHRGSIEGLSAEEADARLAQLSEPMKPEELSALVDAELVTFETFFRDELKNEEPLTKGEKAIVKTFLLYHLVHKPKQDATA